jgi:hypothetical protein
MDKPLPGIEHVIVLMLENRSFDNVFGGLYPDLTKRGVYRGLLGTETNPLNPTKAGGSSVRIVHGAPHVPPGSCRTRIRVSSTRTWCSRSSARLEFRRVA